MTKYNKEMLEKIVIQSECFSDVIRKLGLKLSGGNHSHIKKRIIEYKINTSHFNKMIHYLKPGNNKKSAKDILVLRKNGRRENVLRLRRAMLESGIEHKCCLCSINEWNGEKIVLEIHHKNNNWLDDRLENLNFLCPNCHSQIHRKILDFTICYKN